MNDEVMKKVAAAEMRHKKIELQKLLDDLFETGIVPDSKRNRFLVNLVVFCMTIVANFIKTEDASLL